MNYNFLDFETFYDKGYSLTALSYEEYIYDPRFHVQCLGYQVNDGPIQVAWEDEIPGVLDRILDPLSKNVVVCHNTMFDAAILKWHYKREADIYHCTQAMARALWPQRASSLEQVAISCFPTNLLRRKGKELVKFKGVRDIPQEQRSVMAGYCANDVHLTFECYKHMWRFFPDSELELLDLTLKMFVNRRLQVNRKMLEEYREELLDTRREIIKQSGLAETVLASNDQFAQWVLEKGLPLEKVAAPTKKNPENMKWPLAKDDLKFVELRATHPEYEPVWKARVAVKSTQEITRSERLLLHASHTGFLGIPLNYYAAHTGRWGGTNKINMQNMKRRSVLRKAIMAPPGHMIGVVDSSNIESRLAAWFCDEPRLLAAYRNKEDVYAGYASTVYGRVITEETDPNERFVGKVCILGLTYGLGPPKLQDTFAKGALGADPIYFPLDECKRFVTTYRRAYPAIPATWRLLNEVIENMMIPTTDFVWRGLRILPGRIQLPNGLCLTYPDLHAREIETERGKQREIVYWDGDYHTRLYGGKLLENIIQALARLVIAEHLLKAEARLETMQGHVVLTVHDEIVFVVPEEHAEAAYNAIVAIMRVPPAWCNDGRLVLDAKGGVASNYSK